MTARSGAALLAVCVAAALLAACGTSKDLRYRQSLDGPPLIIPEGLDAPRYSQEMDIPPAGRLLLPVTGLDPDIDKPPSLSGEQ